MNAASQVQTAAAPALRSLEQFLYHEARLLDEQRWEDWEALFTDDGAYWMPATHGQPDPLNHVSLMYETTLLRAVRVRRYSHPNAMSLQPYPRSVHQVSNVMLDRFDSDSGETVVNSRLIMLEFRRDVQQIYGAAVTHHLVRSVDSYRIKLKKVELVNCEGALGNIQIYL